VRGGPRAISADGLFDDLVGSDSTSTITSENGGSTNTPGIVDRAEGDGWTVRDWTRAGNACRFYGERKVSNAYSFMDAEQEHSIEHKYFEHSCTNMQYHQTIATTNARQNTYAAGFDILGVSVSAQSGYDKGTALSFYSTNHGATPEALCGSNPNGIFVSARLQAFNQG
jgi:hypothetical protein